MTFKRVIRGNLMDSMDVEIKVGKRINKLFCGLFKKERVSFLDILKLIYYNILIIFITIFISWVVGICVRDRHPPLCTISGILSDIGIGFTILVAIVIVLYILFKIDSIIKKILSHAETITIAKCPVYKKEEDEL